MRSTSYSELIISSPVHAGEIKRKSKLECIRLKSMANFIKF